MEKKKPFKHNISHTSIDKSSLVFIWKFVKITIIKIMFICLCLLVGGVAIENYCLLP